MTGFDALARDHWEESGFSLLYAGRNGDRSTAILEGARSFACFDKIEVADGVDSRFANVGDLLERKEMEADTWSGCLIIVMDVGSDGSEEPLKSALRLLEGGLPWSSSPQRVAYALTADDFELSFSTFISCVEKDIAGVGDISQCLATLKKWCVGTSGQVAQPPDLRLSCHKQPSHWLRDIRHDYLLNAVARVKTEMEAAGQWAVQEEIDFWQTMIRNVLVFPWERKQAHGIYDSGESSLEICDKVYDTPFHFLVPADFAPQLEVDLRCGEDFVTYQSLDEAASLIAASRTAGEAVLLIRDPAMGSLSSTPSATSGSLATPVPSLLVSEAEILMTWSQWQELFADNVLGAYRQAEFVAGVRQRNSLPRLKRDYWRAFCFCTLADAVDQILRKMIETYGKLDEGKLDDNYRKTLFRCIAEVWCAKGLYFPPESDTGSKEASDGGDG